ncbi:MAG: phenylalanine--tRNA ligase subunit beta [Erysipelotrichaceae bacterium]
MNISKKWLSQYMDIEDVSIEEIADRITNAGLEVEGIEKQAQGTMLTIGLVKTCEMHPDSDHLHVCSVDIASQTLQIVCGAPNIKAGIKVIVAQVGSILPQLTIQKGKIRGIESNGMICSLLELGVDPKSLRDDQKNGIEVLGDDAIIGSDPLTYLGLDDALLDVSLTPNRNDCMAAWSMAIETGAVLNRKVTLPNCEHASEIGTPTKLKVSSTSDKCKLFLGKVINQITIKESPKWMSELLVASGMKSINNVVDISNLVMLETGQPLHFYDLAAIPALEITVKDNIEEIYTALDEVEYQLEKDDIVITSQNKPIGIAGIMGGNDSKIETSTKGIIIEAASFHHVAIRNTSRRLNITSDASIRYQKGIEPLAPFKAIDRAVELLIKYADAKMIEATVQYGENTYQPTIINVIPEHINTLLGTHFTIDEMSDVMQRLCLSPRIHDHQMEVSIPSYRQDLAIENDIAEEIIRLIGYDRLTSTLPTMSATMGALDARQNMRRWIRNTLADLGLYEARTYTLVSQRHLNDAVMPLAGDVVSLASPMSEDRKYVRNSILPSLLDSLAYNENRSQKGNAFFEISSVYAQNIEEERIAFVMSGPLQQSRWQNISIPNDYYTAKGMAMNILTHFGFEGTRIVIKENTVDTKAFHPYKSACIYVGKSLFGIVGEIHPLMAKNYDLNHVVMAELNMEVLLKNQGNKIKFTPISKYPSITRDLALLASIETKAGDIIDVIKKSGKHVVSSVNVFDIYEGEHIEEGYKSVALSISFQANDKTLRDEEINEVTKLIISNLETKLNVTLRG